LKPGGLSNQRPLINSNKTQQHYTEEENEEEEMNITCMSDTHLEATTNQNTKINLSRNIIQEGRKLTKRLQKSIKDHIKDINQKEKKTVT
jgi:hypothetical protein